MPRPANIIPSRRVHVYLPEDLMLKIDLLLYSESEKRVPQGKYTQFFSELVRQYLDELERANRRAEASNT